MPMYFQTTRQSAAIAASLMLMSCATVMPAPRYLPQPKTVYNAADGAWAAKLGKNTISGSALMRTMGGDVKTCAGLMVELIPDTPYARELVSIVYKSPDGGYFPAGVMTAPIPDPAYARSVRRTVCDAQGSFSFDGVADGAYFVTASVIWNIPQQYSALVQGGDIMQPVSVSGGEVRKLVLTK